MEKHLGPDGTRLDQNAQTRLNTYKACWSFEGVLGYIQETSKFVVQWCLWETKKRLSNSKLVNCTLLVFAKTRIISKSFDALCLEINLDYNGSESIREIF